MIEFFIMWALMLPLGMEAFAAYSHEQEDVLDA